MPPYLHPPPNLKIHQTRVSTRLLRASTNFLPNCDSQSGGFLFHLHGVYRAGPCQSPTSLLGSLHGRLLRAPCSLIARAAMKPFVTTSQFCLTIPRFNKKPSTSTQKSTHWFYRHVICLAGCSGQNSRINHMFPLKNSNRLPFIQCRSTLSTPLCTR